MKKWFIGILSLMCTLTSGIALSGCSFGMPQTSTNGSSASEQQSESVESSISESTEESSVEESSTENSSEEDSGETECKHKIVIDESVSATCTTDGLTSGAHCDVCKEIFVKQEVIKASHSEVIDAAKEPTCTETGLTEGKHCDVCKETLVAQEVIDANGHAYDETVTEPTKTDEGYTTFTCSTCGDTYKDNYVPAIGSSRLAYTVNEDGTTCTVIGLGECADTEIVIGKTIDGYTVTAIGEKAFSEKTQITSLVLPDTLKTIGTRAFYGCTGLTEFTVPASVTSIGTQIFYKSSVQTVYYNSTYADKNNPFLKTTSIANIVFNGRYVPSYILYNCASVKTVTIGDSVISISNYAFSSCDSLTSVEIPDSVTSIGYQAFAYCSSLTSVYYTGDIEGWCNISFDDWAANPMEYAEELYINGEQITELVIPDTIAKIRNDAFYNCDSLTSVTIPDSVTSIGSSAFSGCSSLTSVYYTGDIEGWCNISFDGWDANPMAYAEELYINGEQITELVIPDTIAKIRNYAFINCKSLTSVEIPDSVTSIGYYAFSDCDSLTSVTIPDSVTSIGDEAFSGCESLTSVEIPDSVTSIGGRAFRDCSSLTSVEIPDSVTSIGSYAFEYCDSLTSVVIGDSVTSIGDYAFYNCYKLVEVVNKSTRIRVEKGVESNGYVGYYALAVYNSGDTFTSKLSNNNGYIVYTDGEEKILLGYQGAETDLILPSYITKIYQYAFYSCDSLTSVVIGDSVTSIGSYAFENCYKLVEVVNKSTHITVKKGGWENGQVGYYALAVYNSGDTVTGTKVSKDNDYIVYTDGEEKILVGYMGKETVLTLPAYITKIKQYAFYDCDGLTSVVIGDSVTSIGDYAFEGCSSLTSVEIPDSVTSIGDATFAWCSSLTRVVIGDSVTSIGVSVFFGCSSLTSITVSENNAAYKSIDGNLYSKDGQTFIQYAIGKAETSFTIPDSVTFIGNYAFRDCSSLTSVVIGDSVTSIGNYAFYECYRLTSVEIPDSVTSIGSFAFHHTPIYDDENNWENDVLYIGKYLIDAKPTISDAYTIKAGTLVIADEAFFFCDSLTSVEIPDSVTSIGSYAFEYCDSLTSVVIGDSVTSIGNYAFYGCDSLTSVEIPDSVTSIGDEAFEYCSRLTSITFEGTVEQWKAISKGDYWKNGVPATKVVCKDGDVAF